MPWCDFCSNSALSEDNGKQPSPGNVEPSVNNVISSRSSTEHGAIVLDTSKDSEFY